MTDQEQRDMEAQFRADLRALRAERDAALARATRAETAAAIWEQRCSQATSLSGAHLADLAAALRERDEWEEAAKEASAGCHSLGVELHEVRARLEKAEADRARLQRFKDWVHGYLDLNGVPYHPPGAHGAGGCRIGDRLDWLLAALDAARGRAGAPPAPAPPAPPEWTQAADGFPDPTAAPRHGNPPAGNFTDPVRRPGEGWIDCARRLDHERRLASRRALVDETKRMAAEEERNRAQLALARLAHPDAALHDVGRMQEFARRAAGEPGGGDDRG